MVTPARMHRWPEGQHRSLARHVPSVAATVLVAVLAAALSGCPHTSGPELGGISVKALILVHDRGGLRVLRRSRRTPRREAGP